MFNYLGTTITFSAWQDLGFDTHSVVVNRFHRFHGLRSF